VDMAPSADTGRLLCLPKHRGASSNDNADADSPPEVPKARQGYVNPGAGLPIRSADVCLSNDEDADVCPLIRSRGVRYDNQKNVKKSARF